MAATYTASAVFKAVDKVSAVTNKMGKAIQSFSKRTEIAFSRIEMQSRRLTNTFNRLTGVVGKLGLGFGALMIAQNIATATIELDDSMASLSAITGKAGNEFIPFQKKVDQVSKSQKAFAGQTAKAFEVVASAQPILLENANALGKVTEASMILAKASGDELAQSALSLTGVMNQFGLEASQANRVMNALAAGSVAGSANITNVAASMKNFGAVAAGANIKVEEAIALVEVMGSKSIFAEDAGNKLKAAIVNLQKANVGYSSGLFNINDALAEMKAKADAASPGLERDKVLLDAFGKTGIVTGQILLNNVEQFGKLSGVIRKDTDRALVQAAINSNTLSNRLIELQASFKNAVTSTNSENKALQSLKDILAFAASNMDKIIDVSITAIKVFILYKAVVIGAMVAQKGLIAVMAIAKFMKFIRVVMLMAKAKGIWTAAQWALNVALNANPIGIIMLAIAALVGVVTLVIKKWDSWGAAVSLLFGPLGFIISLIQSFRKNWELVKASFSEGGILKGLLTIGKVILDAILMPVQQLLELLGKIPGLDIATTGAEKIDAFRNRLFEQERSLLPQEELQTTATTTAQENIKREERITKQQATLNINNNTDMGMTLDNPKGAQILLTPTN